jgi:hypothetical protein
MPCFFDASPRQSVSPASYIASRTTSGSAAAEARATLATLPFFASE